MTAPLTGTCRPYHAIGSGGLSLAALLDAEASAQRDPQREAAVRACGVPATIVRVGRITDAPGGMQQLRILQVPRQIDGDGCVAVHCYIQAASLQSPHNHCVTAVVRRLCCLHAHLCHRPVARACRGLSGAERMLRQSRRGKSSGWAMYQGRT